MSFFDDSLLLDGADVPPWDEENAPHGVCDFCSSANEADESGEVFCAVCEPRCALEATPLRASVTVDANGQCAWSGWSSDEIALLLMEHTP